ncbi:neuroligin-1-like [Leptidea sinapis]|uniref:neuroligin-1-like n=1 Tax=Leptidea sinapis TaxID=189913 RepID=UPI0021C2C445|nr:neuroligin-1-like [Leptidea sinapis]
MWSLSLCAGLVSSVLLLSGSALGPAARQTQPELARAHAARALRCDETLTHNTSAEHWLTACVRSRPLAALLAVQPPSARFLAGWAPAAPSAPARALHHSDAFLQCALAVVLTTTESYHLFSENEVRHGFEEEHRNRILRTFVRNVYRYHRNEIFAAVRNEYTDWEKPIQHPINIRDATLEALSDAAVGAPALRLAQLHARRGAPTYLAHFAHQTRDADYPQRLGSVSSESLPYFLGLPLVGGMPFYPRNYSRGDVSVAESTVQLLAAFAKTGDPSPKPDDRHEAPVSWPRYELSTQQYLSIGSKIRVKSHYRGHKMALWLHLIPQLHRPGAARSHHQFRAPHPDMFAGDILPELYTTSAALEDEESAEELEELDEVEAPGVEECSPSPPALAALPPPANPSSTPQDSNLAADTQYYRYTAALGVTLGAGCGLLLLNVLVFTGIYLQRGRRRARRPARHGSSRSRHTGCELGAVCSPRKSTLKRSSELELKERQDSSSGAPTLHPPAKKRVQIQEISV